ncbi:MAG: site-2 protease family protein [Sulfuricellaceae bacterium]|jgi:Zn-dependent protease
MELTVVQKIAVYALPVIFAITLHEAAHGYVAKMFGDRTAYILGRVSLNPLRHIDPIGTILIPSLTMLFGGILFGWAKPVPVDFGRLNNPKRDMLWVALAGPGANLVMAVLWAAVMKFAMVASLGSFSEPLAFMGLAGVQINAVLMVLNLMPILPLDGGRIAVSLLPDSLAYRYAQLEPYGLMILVLLLFSGVLGTIISPLIGLTVSLLVSLFGL